MASVTVAATQMAASPDREANLAGAEALVREAAGQGAQIVLLQELFETPYFPQEEKARHFALAQPAEGHPTLARMGALAAELEIVLPVSFFERANNTYFNSIAVFDADGSALGVYRKSHIPDAPRYQEKFYFNPGNTGFRVWPTRYATIGVGICWDQWFPEAARAMVLGGAELLFYPTAIGNDDTDAGFDSCPPWQRAMQGHAASNSVPVVAANRIGTESAGQGWIEFYGSSFIADPTGAKLAEAPRDEPAVILAGFDLEALRGWRAAWGLLRDRRPELYGALLTADGQRGAAAPDPAKAPR